MKFFESFLKIVKKFLVYGEQSGACGMDKPLIIKAKIIVFSSIFIPCLL